MLTKAEEIFVYERFKCAMYNKPEKHMTYVENVQSRNRI